MMGWLKGCALMVIKLHLMLFCQMTLLQCPLKNIKHVFVFLLCFCLISSESLSVFFFCWYVLSNKINRPVEKIGEAAAVVQLYTGNMGMLDLVPLASATLALTRTRC